jgi:hypothetical protein
MRTVRPTPNRAATANPATEAAVGSAAGEIGRSASNAREGTQGAEWSVAASHIHVWIPDKVVYRNPAQGAPQQQNGQKEQNILFRAVVRPAGSFDGSGIA